MARVLESKKELTLSQRASLAFEDTEEDKKNLEKIDKLVSEIEYKLKSQYWVESSSMNYYDVAEEEIKELRLLRKKYSSMGERIKRTLKVIFWNN